IVLADHGLQIIKEPLRAPDPDGRVRLASGPISRAARAVSRSGLPVRGDDNKPLRFDPLGPASLALAPDSNLAIPEIELIEQSDTDRWLPQLDLLKSGAFAKEFVVESEDNGATWIRFGDGRFGMAMPGSGLSASYRIGNGAQGNIGADSIAHA